MHFLFRASTYNLQAYKDTRKSSQSKLFSQRPATPRDGVLIIWRNGKSIDLRKFSLNSQAGLEWSWVGGNELKLCPCANYTSQPNRNLKQLIKCKMVCFNIPAIQTGFRDICEEETNKLSKILKSSLYNFPEISWRQMRDKFTLLQMQSWLILQSIHIITMSAGRKMVRANTVLMPSISITPGE